jgi:hypothetical protein
VFPLFVNDTGGNFAVLVANMPPVSLSGKFSTGAVDTGGYYHRLGER